MHNNFYHLRSAGQAVRESSSQAAGAVARDAGAAPAETSIQQHWKTLFLQYAAGSASALPPNVHHTPAAATVAAVPRSRS